VLVDEKWEREKQTRYLLLREGTQFGGIVGNVFLDSCRIFLGLIGMWFGFLFVVGGGCWKGRLLSCPTNPRCARHHLYPSLHFLGRNHCHGLGGGSIKTRWKLPLAFLGLAGLGGGSMDLWAEAVGRGIGSDIAEL